MGSNRHYWAAASQRRLVLAKGLIVKRRMVSRAASVGITVLGLSVPACSKAGPPGRSTSPAATLHAAIAALEDQDRYSFTVMTDPGGIPSGPASYKVTVQQPDRIAIAGAINIVAVGSTGYRRGAGVWTVVHHPGESRNYLDDMLSYVNLLKNATSVSRTGNTFTVSPTEAASLLAGTGLPQFQAVTYVSYAATVRSGVLRSVAVRLGNARLGSSGPSPFAVDLEVTALNGPTAVTAPAHTVPSGE